VCGVSVCVCIVSVCVCVCVFVLKFSQLATFPLAVLTVYVVTLTDCIASLCCDVILYSSTKTPIST